MPQYTVTSPERERDEDIARAEDQFQKATGESWAYFEEQSVSLRAERNAKLVEAQTAADVTDIEAWFSSSKKILEEDCMWEINPAVLVRDAAIYGAKMRYRAFRG